MRPVFLYIRGLPGTGKITVARVLERRLGYRLFWLHDLDCAIKTISERPLDAVAIRSLLSDITEPVISYLLSRGSNVIYVRPSGDTQVVQRVKSLAEQHGYKFILVTLTADYNTLISRVSGRSGWRLNGKDELSRYFSSTNWQGMEDEITISTDDKTIEQTADVIQKLVMPKRVITNGCFDCLHPGHIYLLKQAKSLGDHLTVAVNDDVSVSRLKGRGRPIQPLQHRVEVLKACRYVDEVIPFREERELLPLISISDILVKGKDWEGREVTGSHIVDKVVFLDVLEGYSTSSTVQRLRIAAS